MRKVFILISVLFVLNMTAWAQLTVKNTSDVTVMSVNSSGEMGIAIGDAEPAATLDVGGDLRIGTVLDEGNTGDISVLVLDGGIVKKRTLTADIWDGDATGSGADGVVSSASFSGTTNKTLTLGRSNGLSDLTASFTDRFEANTDNQNLQQVLDVGRTAYSNTLGFNGQRINDPAWVDAQFWSMKESGGAEVTGAFSSIGDGGRLAGVYGRERYASSSSLAGLFLGRVVIMDAEGALPGLYLDSEPTNADRQFYICGTPIPGVVVIGADASTALRNCQNLNSGVSNVLPLPVYWKSP